VSGGAPAQRPRTDGTLFFASTDLVAILLAATSVFVISFLASSARVVVEIVG